jgi:hypothetical protein
VLTPEEQKIAVRTRKTRKFFVFLRKRRHERLDVALQDTRAATYNAEAEGKAPVDAGMLALATLLQAYCKVGDRDAVDLTVVDKRWQMVLDCRGAEQPPSVRARCSTFACGSLRTTWTKPYWSGRSHWQRRLGDSVPGSCGRPWTPLRCAAPAVWRIR